MCNELKICSILFDSDDFLFELTNRTLLLVERKGKVVGTEAAFSQPYQPFAGLKGLKKV